MKAVLGSRLEESSPIASKQGLLDWTLSTVREAFSQALGGRPRLHADSVRLDWQSPPLTLLDSSTEVVHIFGGRDRTSMGIGAASEYAPASLPNAGRERASNALGLEPGSPTSSKVIVMGGWPFSPSAGRKGRVWRDMPSSRWVVPAIALVSEFGRTTLTVAVLARSRAGAKAQAEAHYVRLVNELWAAHELEQGAPDPPGPRIDHAISLPSEARWLSAARRALDSIYKGRIEKVVLARSLKLVFDGEVQPSTVVGRLLALNPHSTTFAVGRGRSIFLGSTPEKLLSLADGEVEIDCLAASAPRSDDKDKDASLGEELLADPKSRQEHAVVVQAAIRSISPYSSRVEVPESPVVIKLGSVQHLHTQIKARLLPGKDIWTVALSLWPSPAIAGEPKESAVRWIRATEPFCRGWYAGVVGWMGGDFKDGTMVVGIRSGLLKGKEALIYAGAGLVAGSDPRAEFEETRWKLETMYRAFGRAELGTPLPG